MPSHAPIPGSADPLRISGVVPPILTAFDDSEKINLEATAAHAQFTAEAGVDAVFPLGTNGEFVLLTEEERKQIIETVVEAVDIPVIAGVGASGTHKTTLHATHAAKVGADGIVVVTPYYYPLDREAMLDHYTEVVAAVDIPVYIYHIPSKTGNHLSLETLSDLASIEGIAGVKDSSKDIPWLAQAIDRNSELTFMAGSDSLLYPGLEVGCAGLVSAVANVFPELVVDLYDAYDAGNEQKAERLQSQVFDIRSALKQGPYMAGVKTALSLRKTPFDVGGLRSPLRIMNKKERETLRRALERLDLI